MSQHETCVYEECTIQYSDNHHKISIIENQHRCIYDSVGMLCRLEIWVISIDAVFSHLVVISQTIHVCVTSDVKVWTYSSVLISADEATNPVR